jgi:hypothetical protein
MIGSQSDFLTDSIMQFFWDLLPLSIGFSVFLAALVVLWPDSAD